MKETHFSLIHQEYNDAMKQLIALINTHEKTNYVINFASDYANSKIIRDFVGRIFDAFSILQPWRGRFILITDELINNAIEHGSIQGDTNQCIISAGNCENRFHISIEIHDTGNGEVIDLNKLENIKNENLKKSENNNVYMEKRGRWLFRITEKIVDKLSFAESPKWWLAVKIEKYLEFDKPQKSQNTHNSENIQKTE